MNSVDLEVLSTCERWLRAGLRCELVTVLQTWGSSPRPPGAMMALCEDGTVVGSVSGGCIEDDLIARMRNGGMRRVQPEVVRYGIDADEAHRFGLPCGGTVALAIEPLGIHSRIEELLQSLRQQTLMERHLDLRSGAVSLAPAKLNACQRSSADSLISIHGPRWRLMIIGAGGIIALRCPDRAQYGLPDHRLRSA